MIFKHMIFGSDVELDLLESKTEQARTILRKRRLNRGNGQHGKYGGFFSEQSDRVVMHSTLLSLESVGEIPPLCKLSSPMARSISCSAPEPLFEDAVAFSRHMQCNRICALNCQHLVLAVGADVTLAKLCEDPPPPRASKGVRNQKALLQAFIRSMCFYDRSSTGHITALLILEQTSSS
jgi:hypothetical protein